jgi:DNA repair protein RecN (Recombination protein N)
MLALKTIGLGQVATGETAGRRSPEAPSKTLIFDEVDAGIGGRVADVVGARLQELGARFQVLCITHLPQIAARASTQFLIDKSVRGSRTVTRVATLDAETRIDELARMIGGASVTEAVRASARDLLQSARAKGKQKAKGESESRRRG